MTAVGSKCRTCRGPAIIDLPRHNAHFCAEHLLELCRRQVAKAIEQFDMRRVGEFERRRSGAFRAWLRQIVANQARAYFRNRRVEPAVDLDAIAADNSELSRVWDREHDEHIVSQVMRLVERDFNPETWRAFRMLVLDDLQAAEVAAQTGLSLNAVILAKSRVLKRIRAEIRGFLE